MLRRWFPCPGTCGEVTSSQEWGHGASQPWREPHSRVGQQSDLGVAVEAVFRKQQGSHCSHHAGKQVSISGAAKGWHGCKSPGVRRLTGDAGRSDSAFGAVCLSGTSCRAHRVFVSRGESVCRGRRAAGAELQQAPQPAPGGEEDGYSVLCSVAG